MTQELKPCPFCGALFSIDSYLGHTVAVAQHEEWCFFPSFRPHQIQENDFDAWNTRSTDEVFDAKLHNSIERIRDALHVLEYLEQWRSDD